MKKIILLFILVSSLAANAQRPHRDTTLVGFATADNDLITSPIVLGTRQPIEVTPVRQQLCFDDRLDVELIYGGLTMEQAMFMNNADGYIGYTKPGVNGDGPIDMIMPEIQDFNFGLVGFKGNIYQYYNKKDEHGAIRHWVITGNTETHKYVMADGLVNATVVRKNEQRTYCDGHAQAMAYKLPDQPSLWFMYGDHYPSELHVRRYFGGFGVGVVRADEGVYVVMETQAGNNHSILKSIDKFPVCFDPSAFVPAEDQYRSKRRTELAEEAAKIERDEEAVSHLNHCQAEKMAIINFEREQNHHALELLDSTKHGNAYQDRTTQNAYANMMDPLAMTQFGVLQCNDGICGCLYSLSQHADPITEEHLTCLREQLQRLVSLTQQMRDLDRQYAANPALANAKKSQLYLAEMRNGSCN